MRRPSAREWQAIGLVSVFVVAALVLGLMAVWQRQTPAGPPHPVFGRHEYVRLTMPPPPPLEEPPKPGLATLTDDQESDEDAGPEDEPEDAGNVAENEKTEGGAPKDAGGQARQLSFAERFGDVEMVVRNPTWIDLTFDLANADKAQSDLAVAKTLTYQGRSLGSLDLEFGGGSTVLVKPDQLITLLAKTSVDTAGLAKLKGRDRVAFSDLRAAGIDLRYRPAQDQLSLEVAGQN